MGIIVALYSVLLYTSEAQITSLYPFITSIYSCDQMKQIVDITTTTGRIDPMLFEPLKDFHTRKHDRRYSTQFRAV